jgi:hypothetical protein
MIEFHLDTRSGVAPYQQIVQQVRHALRPEFLDVDDQLPTVKEVVATVAITRTRSWPRHGCETRGAGAPAAFVAAGELIAAQRPERGNLRSDGRRSGNGHRPRSCAAGSDQLAAGSPGWLPGPGPAADAA